jgi:hypothetical protein
VNRLRGSATWRLGLAFLLSLGGSAVEGQAPAAERVLIELQLGRIAARTVEAYRVGDAALVPLGAFFELAEIRANRRPDGVLQAIVQPGNQSLVIEPAAGQVHLGKDRIAADPGRLLATESEVFLSTAILGRVLSLDWDISWPDLQVAVIEPADLPVARRLRRESMLRARLGRASEAEHTGLRLGLERPRVDGVVFDYSVLTPTTGVSGTTYSTVLGLDVLGGSLSFGLQSQGSAGDAPRTEASWTGVWRENRYLSQLRIGDGYASGPRARSSRGLSVSNSPYVRPPTIGDAAFAGKLGAGWTVEAYRGGRLIGFDSVNALGQFSFDVPIQYGENPVDFIAYGPFGEVREFNRTYRVATDGLPARQFEYGASLGECRTPLCTATSNVDLRYGASTRWTLRAGLDQFWRDSLGSLTHPYVGFLGALTNAVIAEGEAVGNAVLRGALRYEPTVNLQLGAEVNRFARGVRAPILTPEGRLSQWTVHAFLRPVSRLGGTYLEASFDRIDGLSADISSGRLGGSVQVADVRFLPAVRFQSQTGFGLSESQTFYGLNTFVLPRPSLGRVLGSLTARTAIEFEQQMGASSASAYVGFPVLRGLRGELGTSWFRGMKGPAFSLMVAAELPTVRSYTTMTAGGGHEALGTQYLTGSAIYNPSRATVDFSGMPGLARGGVTGRVFLDANANGRFDPDEEALPAVRVVVGPVFSLTDRTGGFKVWDLLPYEPTDVTVDSASLASPLWVPSFARATVEPSPNRYRKLDIAILPGGVIEGVVRWGRERNPAGATAGGVSIVLRHRQSGEQRVISTFTDGTFYAIGVRPGDWEMRIDPGCLETLAASSDPVRFALAPSIEGTTVSGLELILR